jgi:DNA-binding MarR family transcriptional regulator
VRKSSRISAKDTRLAILHHWREAAPNDRLAHLVRDAGRACMRALQLRLTEHSVSIGHWIFLRILWQADGITQRDLSVQAGVTEPTTFAALKAMEKLGYLKRKQAPNNKKNVYVHLTPKGRALEKKLIPLAEDVNRVAVLRIDPSDVETTREVLLALIENLAADELNSTDAERRVPSTRELSQRVSDSE